MIPIFSVKKWGKIANLAIKRVFLIFNFSLHYDKLLFFVIIFFVKNFRKNYGKFPQN